MAYDIFLSYRRKDAEGHSNVALARTFKLEFERRKYKVFFDYSECTDNRFSDIILPAIRTCSYFVLLLTKDALERCKNEGDWVRREIEEALKYNRKIIPITSDEDLCDYLPQGLPQSLTSLYGEQITTIHMDRVFEANIELLIQDRGMAPLTKGIDNGGSLGLPNLKVKCNLDSELYIDGEQVESLVANQLKKVPLAEGEYLLRVESVEDELDYVEEEFEMPNMDKLYSVDLLVIKDKRLERERIEEKEWQERVRREKEANGEFEVNGVKFNMVYVKGGTFMMGATMEQGYDALDEERPVHRVALSDYYIGETVVTQALWNAVMKNNPSYPVGDNLPVVFVSWDDAQEFITELNVLTGRTFRLPTEAEWEYAARGGKNTKGNKYSGSSYIDAVAWYIKNSEREVHPVGQKGANELGLYDMSGNVSEWCADWYGGYDDDVQTNPKGANSGSYRVLRGGRWGDLAICCRVSSRKYYNPSSHSISNGFRLALSL